VSRSLNGTLVGLWIDYQSDPEHRRHFDAFWELATGYTNTTKVPYRRFRKRFAWVVWYSGWNDGRVSTDSALHLAKLIPREDQDLLDHLAAIRPAS